MLRLFLASVIEKINLQAVKGIANSNVELSNFRGKNLKTILITWCQWKILVTIDIRKINF